MMKINLGAGSDIKSGYINVDHLQLDGIDIVHNLVNFPYPFEDNSAERIEAWDVIEHLPSHTNGTNTVMQFVEECHRILKPGGILFMQTPRYDAAFLWIDLTHVRGFHEESMDFYDPTKHYGKTTGFYSPCKFKVSSEVLTNKNLRFTMEKL